MAKGNYFEVPGLVEVDSRLCCTTSLSGFEAARFKIFERYKYYIVLILVVLQDLTNDCANGDLTKRPYYW
jgi:hypothetical protein